MSRDQVQVIRAKSPLRISFAGGITDMPSYYLERGGAVLVSTINRYAFTTLQPRDDDQIQIKSLDFGLTVKYHIEADPIYDGILDLAKAAVNRIKGQTLQTGFDLYLQSDAPAGSGLGGSASLTTAILGALGEHTGMKFDKHELAELAYAVERIDLGISGGKQDQYATVFGGFNLIEFSKEGVTVNPLDIPSGILNDLEYHTLLCYTGKTRLSMGLIDQQERFYKEGRSETVAGLDDLRQLAYDMKRALTEGRLEDFGDMLHTAWERKVQVNPHITDPKIDDMYETARNNGALGGKLLGAGGGGYLLIFCPGDKKQQIREKLEALGGQLTDFSFIDAGIQTWTSRFL